VVEIPSRPPTSILVNLVQPNGRPESLQGHIRPNILLVACEGCKREVSTDEKTGHVRFKVGVTTSSFTDPAC